MGRRQRFGIPYFAVLLALGACGPDEDVELLALPPLERPSPEARLGIPEVAGVWSFAGWEIIEGDSTSLDRTFPSFGELRFATQRLDSIAGSFVLGGTPVPVIGDVRRDGRLTFVTLAGGTPQSFVAGSYVQDTLWLELSTVLPADEWPRDARAAFVRQQPSEPAFAWLRGARVQEAAPPPLVDSLAAGLPAPPGGVPAGATLPGASTNQGGAGAGAAPTGQPRPAQQQPSVTTPRPSGQQPAVQPRPAAQQPPAQQAPAQQQPARPPVSQPEARPPAQQPTVQQPGNQPAGQPTEPAPAAGQPARPPAQPPQPAPTPEPPADDPGPLLGDPIDPQE